MAMRQAQTIAAALALCAAVGAAPAPAQEARSVTLAADTVGTPAERAVAMLAQMTLAEKLTLLEGYFATDFPPTRFEAPEEARPGSAGYVPGISRLGIPPQWQTDAGLGVATQGGAAEKRSRTALPSGLATAATWDTKLAYAGGRMIGSEARADGFNVLLGGSVNLVREPRNGRNFEYAGEDPLLAGAIVGAQIAGVQSNHVISTVKHYALNDQETDRGTGNFIIDEAAFRMSDLLAFQLAIERGRPGSAMCAYNLVNGLHACEHPFLLTQVLRKEWGWHGYVMSDWGAAHSSAASANAGLDQESGFGLQTQGWFAADKLREAIERGEIAPERIDLMAGRILTSMFAYGLIDDPVTGGGAIDFAGNRAVSQRDAEAGIVLLKNDGDILPIAATAGRIAVIGGHADKGVLSGGGSSQVYPDGENAVPGIEPTSWPGPVVYYPSAPLEELRKLLPDARIDFADGSDLAAAARLAAASDLAVVFGTQWASESIDVAMKLDGEQDALIEAVVTANPNTIVVLETGGPVLMRWADEVPAIVEAWYPGRMGGAAIAGVLTGTVNPSGHLPVTFPRGLNQLPWPGEPRKGEATYSEGAAVGYKWFDANGLEPLFPFGHGLSYTTFAYDDLAVTRLDEKLMATVRVTNTGKRAGFDAVQVYVAGPQDAGWEAPRRLGGFAKVGLQPGESKLVGIEIDPRLLSVWDTADAGWTRATGDYTVTAAQSSRDLDDSVTVALSARKLPPQWKPHGQTAAFDSATEDPSPLAENYLQNAITLLRERHINSESADWPAIVATAKSRIVGAGTTADTYTAIRGMLAALGERHSFLMEPRAAVQTPEGSQAANKAVANPEAELLGEGIGLVRLPQLNTLSEGGEEAAKAYTDTLVSALKGMDQYAACGWIVDLRGNGGGNMWPMLRGLDPLLGEEPFGYFVVKNGIKVPWVRSPAGVAPWTEQHQVREPSFTLEQMNSPVAVLLGSGTASSGEMTALALIGRHDVRTFGAATAGFTTANTAHPMGDGAVLVVTESTVRDRTGKDYHGPIVPDEQVAPRDAEKAATRWLERRCDERPH